MGCTTSQLGAKAVPEDAYCPSSTVKTPPANQHNGVTVTRSTGDQYFSHHQKRLIRETWKVISMDQQNHGINLFLKIFHKKPETKLLFPFGKLNDEELLQNPMFRSHAKRFMHAVHTTVENLDALEVALIPVLLRLGEKHVTFEGFRDDYLQLFMSSILEVFSEVLGKKCTNEVRDAWNHLATFIADKMQEGYQNAMRRLKGVQLSTPVHTENVSDYNNDNTGGNTVSNIADSACPDSDTIHNDTANDALDTNIAIKSNGTETHNRCSGDNTTGTANVISSMDNRDNVNHANTNGDIRITNNAATDNTENTDITNNSPSINTSIDNSIKTDTIYSVHPNTNAVTSNHSTNSDTNTPNNATTTNSTTNNFTSMNNSSNNATTGSKISGLTSSTQIINNIKHTNNKVGSNGSALHAEGHDTMDALVSEGQRALVSHSQVELQVA